MLLQRHDSANVIEMPMGINDAMNAPATLFDQSDQFIRLATRIYHDSIANVGGDDITVLLPPAIDERRDPKTHRTPPK